MRTAFEIFIILETPTLDQSTCLSLWLLLSLWLFFLLGTTFYFIPHILTTFEYLFCTSFHFSSCEFILMVEQELWSCFIYSFLCPQGVVATPKVSRFLGLRVDCIWLYFCQLYSIILNCYAKGYWPLCIR